MYSEKDLNCVLYLLFDTCSECACKIEIKHDMTICQVDFFSSLSYGPVERQERCGEVGRARNQL